MSDYLILKSKGQLVQVVPATDHSCDDAFTRLKIGNIDTIQICNQTELSEAISATEPLTLIKNKINEFSEYLEKSVKGWVSDLPSEKDLGKFKDSIINIGQNALKEVKSVLAKEEKKE